MTCGFQLSAVKLGDLLKPLLLSRLVPQLPIHYDQHSLESVSLREKIKQCTIYNVALSQSDIGERPCILTSRSHCLHVYSHSVEQNTFYLPDCHKTHTYHLPLSTSQPLILNFLSFQTMILLVVLFLNEKLVSLYAFYGLQNAAYNNVFNINVQDFCGSMTVCFVFFCTANVDKKGGWETKGHQMLLYCCRHAIVIFLPSTQWPVFWK